MSSVIMTDAELARVRSQLEVHGWYREVLEGFRGRVEELLARAPEIPVAKGRAFYESCPRDHALLTFDPYDPSNHVCPRCGGNWQGELYDLAWLRQFQGWHAKRLVEAGILYRLEGDERHARLVRGTFDHFIRRYRDYPLANNLLGPTRLFQSTFLEAFWLVDMVAAYDLTRASGAYSPSDHSGVRDLLFESSAVVRGFDEGVSNRQAFNNAGMGAVALLYEDEALLAHVLQGPHGFAFHIRESLLEDGIWYEGETYHFATLDHSLNLAEMARHRGVDLYRGSSGHGSLKPMLDGPLEVMLPDLTFPSRKDSWFGRGIGYHKEIYELGFARYGDERYGGLLAHAYANGASRRDLGWRAFLYLEPELPEVHVEALRPTACERMPGTGVAVLRREGGGAYASLEYGHYGGGHGHPDRLHLTLHAAGVHWLLDPGTGWYHVPELGWYRSTLAHNTVSRDGDSQNESSGELSAFGQAGDWAAAQAIVEGAYPGTTLRRTLCLADGHLLDVFEAKCEDGAEHTFDWAFNARGELRLNGSVQPPGEALPARGGYPFLAEAASIVPADDSGNLDGIVLDGDKELRVLQRPVDSRFRARAMGIPLQEERPFNTVIARGRGERASFATAWSWAADGPDARLEEEGILSLGVGEAVHSVVLDEEPGVAVVTLLAGTVRSVAWFGRRTVAHDSLLVACDRTLAQAALTWNGGRLTAELPDGFGRVRLSGAGLPATARVDGLPEGASWRTVDGDLLIIQSNATDVWLQSTGEAVTLAAGLENELCFVVARYDRADAAIAGEAGEVVVAGDMWPPLMEAPRGWADNGVRLVAVDGPLETWVASVRVPGNAAGRYLIRLSGAGRTAVLPVEVSPPVAVEWSVSSVAGQPELSLRLRETATSAGRVWGELHAPWLVGAPYPFTLELGAGEEGEVRLPLPARPVPPTAPEPESWPGDQWTPLGAPRAGEVEARVHGDNQGEYHVAALVRRDEFAGVGRARFPLAWAQRRSRPVEDGQALNEFPTGGFRLDRVEQAYWAEAPWQGPNDASAVAHLEWDDGGLRLECLVRDDVHVSDANDEDLYENDSLQLYLDFRPPVRQDSTFAPGVAAFILAPEAERGTVRIEAIAGSRELANRGLVAPWFTTEGVEASSVPCAGDPASYRLSAYFPYASLGVSPLRHGDVFRADLSLSDNDGAWYRTHQLVWSGAHGRRRCYLRWAYLDPDGYGWVLAVDADERPSW
jgi:hypothetical protein